MKLPSQRNGGRTRCERDTSGRGRGTMKTETWFGQQLTEYANDPDFLIDGLLLEVTDQICVRLSQLDMRPADLAQRLGTSRAYVSQLLNGRPNMTMRTLVAVAHALG